MSIFLQLHSDNKNIYKIVPFFLWCGAADGGGSSRISQSLSFKCAGLDSHRCVWRYRLIVQIMPLFSTQWGQGRYSQCIKWGEEKLFTHMDWRRDSLLLLSQLYLICSPSFSLIVQSFLFIKGESKWPHSLTFSNSTWLENYSEIFGNNLFLHWSQLILPRQAQLLQPAEFDPSQPQLLMAFSATSHCRIPHTLIMWSCFSSLEPFSWLIPQFGHNYRLTNPKQTTFISVKSRILICSCADIGQLFINLS